MLTADSISLTYPGAAGGSPVEVLREVSLTVAAGERVAVVGPSGSGKSSLLHLLGGLDVPTHGSVSLGGQDLAALSDKARAAVRNQDVGFVFQQHLLLPQCTALENVLVPALVGGPVNADIAERGKVLLERAGLGDRLGHRPGELSGGECQRVAVVRALIHQPQLVLADEPTGSLDGVTADEVADLLVALNEEMGTALVVVTHSPELAARMQRSLRLESGRLVDA